MNCFLRFFVLYLLTSLCLSEDATLFVGVTMSLSGPLALSLRTTIAGVVVGQSFVNDNPNLLPNITLQLLWDDCKNICFVLFLLPNTKIKKKQVFIIFFFNFLPFFPTLILILYSSSLAQGNQGKAIFSIQRLCSGKSAKDLREGANILDYEGFNPNPQIEPAFQFLEEQSPDTLGFKQPVSAVIGDAFSFTSIPQQFISREFGIPQISPTASSPTLSDKSTYPLFARLIASDTLQGPALARLMKKLGWRKFAIMRTPDDYSIQLTNAVIEESKKIDMTISTIQSFEPSQSVQTQLELVRQSLTHIILLISLTDGASHVIEQAEKLGMTGPPYVWIGTDGWSDAEMWIGIWNSMKGGIGSLGIFPLLDRTTQGFKESNSYWLKKYQEDPQNTVHTSDFNVWVGLSFDSVLLVAHALHDHIFNNGNCQFLFQKKSNSSDNCILPWDTIQKQEFQGSTGHIKLDENGDRQAELDIVNMQVNPALLSSNDRASKVDLTLTIIEQAKKQGIPPAISISVGKIDVYGNVLLDIDAIVWPGGATTIPIDSPDILDPVMQLCGFPTASVTGSSTGLWISMIIPTVLMLLAGLIMYLVSKKWKMFQKMRKMRGIIQFSIEDKLRIFSLFLSCIQLCALGINVDYAFGSSDSWVNSMKSIFGLTYINISFITSLKVYWVMLWMCTIFGIVFFIYVSIFYMKWDKYVPAFIMDAFPIFGAVVGTVAFIPIMSTLLSIFQCTEESNGTPFLARDCQVWCWKGKHLTASIVSGISILLYLPLVLWARPIWQEVRDGTILRAHPTYTVYSAGVKLVLVLNSTFLQVLPVACSIIFLVFTTGMLIYTISKSPFNVSKINLYCVASWSFPAVGGMIVLVDTFIFASSSGLSPSIKSTAATNETPIEQNQDAHSILAILMLILWIILAVVFIVIERVNFSKQESTKSDMKRKKTTKIANLLNDTSGSMSFKKCSLQNIEMQSSIASPKPKQEKDATDSKKIKSIRFSANTTIHPTLTDSSTNEMEKLNQVNDQHKLVSEENTETENECKDNGHVSTIQAPVDDSSKNSFPGSTPILSESKPQKSLDLIKDNSVRQQDKAQNHLTPNRSRHSTPLVGRLLNRRASADPVKTDSFVHELSMYDAFNKRLENDFIITKSTKTNDFSDRMSSGASEVISDSDFSPSTKSLDSNCTALIHQTLKLRRTCNSMMNSEKKSNDASLKVRQDVLEQVVKIEQACAMIQRLQT